MFTYIATGAMIGIVVLLLVETVAIIMLKKDIKRIVRKIEKYLQYILEDNNEEDAYPINIEETAKAEMDNRQKEMLIQEVLSGFFS